MSFSEKLQLLRKERGLSQEGLAEVIGVSRQAVAKWELGQSYPDIDKLIQLSNMFKISIDKLVKDCEEGCSASEEDSKQLAIDNEIINFLIKAKKATYAGKGVEVLPSRPNSHDFQYIEGDLKYIDTYLGGEKFVGRSIMEK